MIKKFKFFESIDILWEEVPNSVIGKMDDNYDINTRYFTDSEIKRIKNYILQYNFVSNFRLFDPSKSLKGERNFYKHKLCVSINNGDKLLYINVDDDEYYWVSLSSYNSKNYKADSIDGLFQVIDLILQPYGKKK